MGKVYPFPENKKKKYEQASNHSSQTMFLKELIETLIYTYEEKIEMLKDYKKEIRRFEGYPFTLALDVEVMRIFDHQINKLEITIDTLKNTSV